MNTKEGGGELADILIKTFGCSEIEGVFHTRRNYYDTVTRSAKEVLKPVEDMAECRVRYSRNTAEVIDSWCDDGDLHEIHHDGDGGITDDVTVNSSQCTTGEPEKCSLEITSLDITHESAPGANDGKVTIHTTLPSSDLEYQLGSRFQYDNNVFTGLSPGSYEIVVRDISFSPGEQQTLDKCEDFETFIIDEFIGYNPKWFFEYKDKQERWTKVIISSNDYDGEAKEAIVGNEPVKIDWKGRGKDNTIIPSELVMELVSEDDFEYLSLFSSDDRAHKVEMLKTDQYGIYHLFWTGYIVPDVYREPYTAPPYLIRVSASDGLVNLKNIDARFFSQKIQGDYMMVRDVIYECLRQTKLGLNVYESIDLYENRNLSSQIYHSPIAQQYVRAKAYEGLTFYQVLENLIGSYGARLYQTEGSWHIIPKAVLKNDPYPWRYFDQDGQQLFSSRNPNLRIGSSRLGKPFWLNNAQALDVHPAWKQASIQQEFNTTIQILPHGEFTKSDFRDGQLIGWTGPHNHVQYKEDDEIKNAVSLNESIPINPYYILSPSISIDHNSFVGVFSTIIFKTRIRIVNEDLQQEVADHLPVKVAFLINIGDKWLHNDGTWGDEQYYICDFPEFNVFHNFEAESDPIPEGDLRVRCLGWIYTPEEGLFYRDLIQTQIEYITVDFLPLGKYPDPESRFVLVNEAEDLTFTPQDKYQFHGDAPYVPMKVNAIGGNGNTMTISVTPDNAKNIFPNSFYVMADGAMETTKSWHRFNVTEEERLNMILLKRMIASHNSPKQVLTGTMEADSITLHNTFTDQYNPGRLFYVNSMTYKDRSKQYDVELMELGEFELEIDNARLLEDGSFRELEDGSYRLLETAQGIPK